VWSQAQLASQSVSGNCVEYIHVGTGIGKENVVWVYAKRSIFLLGPTTASDPMIPWSGRGKIESCEKTMLKMKWTGHLKNSWDRTGFSRRRP